MSLYVRILQLINLRKVVNNSVTVYMVVQKYYKTLSDQQRLEMNMNNKSEINI